MAEIERKAISVKLLDGDGVAPGSFTAQIATLNVIDHGNDITLPGAFGEKTVLISAYMHGSWQGALPVGKATIKEVGDQVIAEGQFNLNSQSGKDHYESVKFSGALQEWSYGFIATEWEMQDQEGQEVRLLKKVEPFEISPVLKGEGIDTSTLAIKAENQTYADHVGMVLAAVSELMTRTKSLADLRRKDGRVMSEVNIERMKKLASAMRSMADDMDGMMDAAKPMMDPGKALALLAEFTRLEHQILTGV